MIILYAWTLVTFYIDNQTTYILVFNGIQRGKIKIKTNVIWNIYEIMFYCNNFCCNINVITFEIHVLLWNVMFCKSHNRIHFFDNMFPNIILLRWRKRLVSVVKRHLGFSTRIFADVCDVGTVDSAERTEGEVMKVLASDFWLRWNNAAFNFLVTDVYSTV